MTIYLLFVFNSGMKINILNFNKYNLKTIEKKDQKNVRLNSCVSDVFCKNNDITFCARKIQDVNLKKRKGKQIIPAQICELNYSEYDKNLLLNLASYWRDTSYASDIVDDYYVGYNSRYFAVALGNSSNVKADDIKSIVEFEVRYDDYDDDGYCYINYLQAAPEIANNKKSPIRGAGELALYAVVDFAKKNNYRKVALYSSNNSFYEKMGFENDGRRYKVCPNCDFHLDKYDYDWFLEHVRKKYGF